MFMANQRLTQRAADGWDSAAFSGVSLASGFFCSQNFLSSHPPAANANRWAGYFQERCLVRVFYFQVQERSHGDNARWY